MPQELHVVCCYACKMFQVDIVKKAKKWQCKICNEKQSLQRVYFQGTGKDCRIYVQKLNTMARTQFETQLVQNTDFSAAREDNYQVNPESKKVSKWSKYLDSTAESTESNATEATTSYDCDYESVKRNSYDALETTETVIKEIDINNKSDEDVLNIDERVSQDDSLNHGHETQTVLVDYKEKLSTVSKHNTTNVRADTGVSKVTTDSKSIFENNEDIDFPLDF